MRLVSLRLVSPIRWLSLIGLGDEQPTEISHVDTGASLFVQMCFLCRVERILLLLAGDCGPPGVAVR